VTTNKSKGTAWEAALVSALRRFFGVAPEPLAPPRFGLAPRRSVQEGFADTGDLHGLDPFIGQAKAWTSWQDAIREGLDGAEAQRVRAGADYGVAFVKRVRRSVGAGYAVMTVATFARVLLRLRRAEDYLAAADPRAYLTHVQETAAELGQDFPKA
jgi:hypothetical protein